MNHLVLHPGARHQKSDPAGLSHVRVKAVSTKWDVKVTKAYTATFCTDKGNSYVLAEFDSNGYGFGMDLMSMQNRRNSWIRQLLSVEASRIVQSSLPSALYDTLLYLSIRPVCTPSSWICLLLGFTIPHAITRYISLQLSHEGLLHVSTGMDLVWIHWSSWTGTVTSVPKTSFQDGSRRTQKLIRWT